MLTLAIPPTPQPLAKVAQKIDEDMEVPRRLTGVLGIYMLPPVSRPCEEWSSKISYRSMIL